MVHNEPNVFIIYLEKFRQVGWWCSPTKLEIFPVTQI